MRAAKLLLSKGELPEGLSKEALRGAAAGVVVATMGRLFSEESQLPVLSDLIRAVAKIAEQSEPLAGAMLARVCYLGPNDVTDSIRRLVHDDKVAGSDKVAKLQVTPEALFKVAKIPL